MTARQWLTRLDKAVVDSPLGSPVRLVAGGLGVVAAVATLLSALVLGLISLIYGFAPGLGIATLLLLVAALLGAVSLPNLRRRRRP